MAYKLMAIGNNRRSLVPATKRTFAKVDADKFDFLSQWAWYLTPTGYAARSYRISPTKRGTVYMHRVVSQAPDGVLTDHINLDKLDNRTSNLRLVTRYQNSLNKNKNKNNKSGYKGVYWSKDENKWFAKIQSMGKLYFIGKYATPLAAARAYDKKASELHGEFAGLNFG